MASTISSRPEYSNTATPKYAVVRHYNVLFSADKDKRDTNRVWHDGRLAHHTYNGKVILYDEADIELGEQFHTNGSPIEPGGPTSLPLFADDCELTVREFVVQVQSFQRVTRTDITPLLHTKELSKARKKAAILSSQSPMAGSSRGATATVPPRTSAQCSSSAKISPSTTTAPQGTEPSVSGFRRMPVLHPNADSRPLRPIPNVDSPRSNRSFLSFQPGTCTPTTGAAATSASTSGRKGPASPHPFRTPFKSPSLKRKTNDGEEVLKPSASPLSSATMGRSASASRGKVDAEVEVARKKTLDMTAATRNGVS